MCSCATLAACSNGSDAGSPNHGGAGGNGAATSSAGSVGKAGTGGRPTQPVAGSGPSEPNETGQVPTGQLEDPPETALPPLPKLDDVVALQGDDSASISFYPVDGAVDYRVYVLPADDDISVSGKEVTIKDATYRCAGTRESPPPSVDAGPALGGNAITTRVEGVDVAGYKRTLPDATLGYAYSAPGPGLVPVYVLGESNPNADSTCFYARWAASRYKRYTTSKDERDELLGEYARDDGVAFYVPEAASDATKTVYTDEQGLDTPYRGRFYTVDGPEAASHAGREPAFQLLKAAADGAKPVMRVHYGNACGWIHDELVLGEEWFKRARYQGDKLPMFKLLWTGITKPTTLVVEALDAGCPFQGHLSPQSMPALTRHLGDDDILHQPWVTLSDMRSAASTGEVFINGHYDAASKPKAIARSFIAVEPVKHPEMDFLATFGPDAEPESFAPVTCTGTDCYQVFRQQSATFDQMFINAEDGPTAGQGLLGYGAALGEWWISYSDISADTNGKYRLTANQKANLSTDKYLHVTMEVDMYATARRYPQIIISDADAPVQFGLEKAHSLIVQPRAVIYGGPDDLGDYPVNFELQVCNLRTWDVNNQCPVYDLYHVMDGDKIVRLMPNDEVGEYASADHRALFDVYASTKRVYLFLEGKPYGCADLPDSIMQAGPTTVTWGDALYHSSVDHVFKFHKEHMLVEQRRHFDNLGFSSDVAKPSWDEKRFPCAAPIAL